MFKAKDCKVSLNGKELSAEHFDISTSYEDDNYGVPEEQFNRCINEQSLIPFDWSGLNWFMFPGQNEFNFKFDDVIDETEYYEIHDDKIILFGFMGDNVIHIIRNNQDEVFNKICNYLIENHYDKYMG